MAGVIKTFVGQRVDGRRDTRAGMELARESDPLTNARAVGYRVDLAVLGFDAVDEGLVTDTERALRLAESFGNTYGLALARWAHGSALLRSDDPRRRTGFDLLRLSRSDGVDFFGSVIDADLAADVAQQGDAAIDSLRLAVLAEIECAETLFAAHSLGVLVWLLVGRGMPDDVAQTRDVVKRFEALLPQDPEPAVALGHCSTGHGSLAQRVTLPSTPKPSADTEVWPNDSTPAVI